MALKKHVTPHTKQKVKQLDSNVWEEPSESEDHSQAVIKNLSKKNLLNLDTAYRQ